VGTPRPSGIGPGPRKLTGKYWKSIKYVIGSIKEGDLETEVGSDAVQARRLEFGGPGGFGVTHPHPHWGPAFDETFGPDGGIIKERMTEAAIVVASRYKT
jgi:hypothetical protein